MDHQATHWQPTAHWQPTVNPLETHWKPTVCQPTGDEKLPPEPQTGEAMDIVIPGPLVPFDHHGHMVNLIQLGNVIGQSHN